MLNHQRRGFSLVELIVIVAIVGLLIALLLPAVQQARESSRRTGCTNQLKQIGLALYYYHDTHEAFPPGIVARADHANAAKLPIWSTLLLPYLELDDLYQELQAETDNFRHDISSGDESPHGAASTVVPAFHCPSDIMGGLNTLREQTGKSNYMACGGSRRVEDNQFQSSLWDGAFCYGESRSMRDFTDGTSRTLLIGERDGGNVAGDLVSRRTAAWWAGTGNAGNFDLVFPPASSTYPINSPNTGFEPHRTFGSFHPGGAIFIYGDGHISFLTEHVHGSIYQSMATRAGSEISGGYVQ